MHARMRAHDIHSHVCVMYSVAAVYPIACVVAGVVSDRHEWQARHQGQSQALTSLPGFPGQVPRSGC